MNLKESLETINDSRIDRCKKHSLVDILMIVFFGLLCGYKSIESIHLYAELSLNVLKKYLLLANGIPSADTILRVLARIDTEQLEKSNEITAIPELLELLDLKGVIVTVDAMGCQKKIAGKITEKKSDYVFSLKGNQEKIHDDVKAFFTSHELDEKYCERYKIQKYEGELEIGHGRIEKRDGYLCTNIKWLEGKAEWPNLKAVGMVRCQRTEKKTGKESLEMRFFITSLTDAGKACEAMCSHCGVENGLHWELDVVFGEDLSQLRKDNSAANMNIIRKLVINILKQTDFSEFTKAKSVSISGKQMLCDKREECLEKVCRNI